MNIEGLILQMHKLVNTFTESSGQGSPVTVYLDYKDRSLQEMQAIAAKHDLPTTTFVLKPTNHDADYRVRIIARHGDELSFAGHSSMGTAFALVQSGFKPKQNGYIVQECLEGLIKLKFHKNVFQFNINVNADKIEKPDQLGRCFDGIQFSNLVYRVNASGPEWLVAEAKCTPNELLNAKVHLEEVYSLSSNLNATGLCVYAVGSEHTEVRSFASGFGEEFVCGSGNASVAFVKGLKNKVDYTAEQGGALNRPGTITVSYVNNEIWIGGPCVFESI